MQTSSSRSCRRSDEVGDGIVRVNSGHDSNIGRDEVIRATERYPRRFFNTSIAKFDFPAPVVLTANPREEEPVGQPIWPFRDGAPRNLMFVRLRVSSTNLDWVRDGVGWYTSYQVPVVLTFMAYYTAEPQVPADVLQAVGGPCYEWRGSARQLLLVPDAGFHPLGLGPVRRQPPCVLLRQPGRPLLPSCAATVRPTTSKPSNA